MTQCGNTLGLGLTANSTGISLDTILFAGGSSGLSAAIPGMGVCALTGYSGDAMTAGIDLAVRCDTADCIDVLGADLGSRIGVGQGSGVTQPLPAAACRLAEDTILGSAGDFVPCDGDAALISFRSGQCGGGKAGGIDTGSHIASCIGFSVRCDTADGVDVLGASLGSRISVGQGSGVTYTPPVTGTGFAKYTVLSSAGDLAPCDGDATVIGLHCGQLGSSRVGDGQASIIVAAGIDLAVRCDTADCIDVLGADLGSRIGEGQGSGVAQSLPVTGACLAEYTVLGSARDLVPCDGNAVIISFHSGQCGGGKADGFDTCDHIASCIGFSVRCDTADGVDVLGASLGSRISVGQGSGVTYTPPVTGTGFAKYTVLSSAGDLAPCDGDATVIGLHCGQLGSSRVGDGQASIIVAAGIDLAVRCDTADCIDVLGADLGSRIGVGQGSGVTYPLPVTVAGLAEYTVLSSAGDLAPCDGDAVIGSGHAL